MDGLHLKNGFSLGENKSMTEAPRVHASLGVGYRPRNLSAIVNATVTLADLCLDGGSQLHFDITRLRQITLSRMLSRGHCGLVPFQHRIYNSPNGSRIGTFVANASASVTGDPSFDNFTVFLDTVEYPSAASLVTSILGWSMNTLKDSLNSAVRSSTDQADDYCTTGHKFGFDDDPPVLHDGFEDEWLFPILSILFFIVVAAQVVFYYIQSWPSCRGENEELR